MADVSASDASPHVTCSRLAIVHEMFVCLNGALISPLSAAREAQEAIVVITEILLACCLLMMTLYLGQQNACLLRVL